MRNYLVVGVNGTIGAALFARLQSTETTVWGTTQRQSSEPSPNIFYLNLLDAAWSFPPIKFDVAYLCAGICRMSLCEDDPSGTYKVNVEAMTALANHLSQQGTFVVYLSTNQVFFGDESFVSPHAPYQPLNEYGRQKALVETAIKTNNPNSAIVRLTKVVEPNMALIKNWMTRLQDNQIVEAFHDMMLAPVALRQVLDVLISVGQKNTAGCYQVSGAEDVSYYDLALILADRLGCSPALVHSVSAEKNGMRKIFLPRFTTLDCSSTIALCGAKSPQISDVLRECFDIEGAKVDRQCENF